MIVGASMTIQAQDITPKLHRLDATAQLQALAKESKLQSVSIATDNAHDLVASIREAGYHAMVVGEGMATATIPAHFLRETLSADNRIRRIHGSHPFQDVGVKTIRESGEFETPFTGKGVLVAMIDGGFKYDHIAFLDKEGNHRVKMIWNRKDWSQGVETEPTDVIPAGNDDYEAPQGHGTHTAGIAAGSIISNNDYSGVAPEADILMISTSMWSITSLYFSAKAARQSLLIVIFPPVVILFSSPISTSVMWNALITSLLSSISFAAIAILTSPF